MQQINLSNFVNMSTNLAAAANRPITVNGEEILPANATKSDVEKASKNIKNKSLQAAKEIGITVGMGMAGGALAGGIACLIPTKNTDRISNVLCDVFVQNSLGEGAKEGLGDANFKNATEQLKFAEKYVEISKKVSDGELNSANSKDLLQKFSEAAWALKQSALEYIEKAGKEDGLLNFAKKEAGKLKRKDVMRNALSIGTTTALIVLLFNTMASGFDKKTDKK